MQQEKVKFIVDGDLTVEVDEARAEDFVGKMQALGAKVEKDDWTIVGTKEDVKIYNSVQFLEEAKTHFDAKPQNLIQSAEKCWLAAAYSIKHYYLALKIHAVSHNALRYLADVGMECVANRKLLLDLVKAWHIAQSFHEFAYGSDRFTIARFEDHMERVEFFVDEFKKIDTSKVLRVISAEAQRQDAERERLKREKQEVEQKTKEAKTLAVTKSDDKTVKEQKKKIVVTAADGKIELKYQKGSTKLSGRLYQYEIVVV
ncbi:hypothetical protein M3Y98_00367100 [Aphelenchoides besseyi]|nr:hypothetical protein M3Y98_00367100 [Aphelenchoides besseyi]KAI6201771.1 hypothetical protein M3Y96_00877700 [Aphelenchoides besseyi]